MVRKEPQPSPPWEVLSLVAHRLDPKTLAVVSCVCKSWSVCMSADALWEPICNAGYPSLCNLRAANPNISFRSLFAAGHTAACKRHCQKPLKPRLSLDDLFFAIDIRSSGSQSIATVTKPGKELECGKDKAFQFEIETERDHTPAMDNLGHGRITWTVVLKGWQGVFTLMDCTGKLNFLPGSDGWFSQQLPPPQCCSTFMGSGIVADVKVGFCNCGEEDGMVQVETVVVGILSIIDWRYVSIDDGLRYLEQFLLC